MGTGTDRLHSTTDAEVWAKEFTALFGGVLVRHEGGAPSSIDEECEPGGIIHSWFANAIECGRSHGYTEGAARTERIDTGEYERGRREGWNAAARSARQAWKDAYDLPEGPEVSVLEHAIVDDLTKRALHREGGLPVPPGVQVPSTRDMAKRYVTLMKRLAAGEEMTLGKPFWEEYRNSGEIHQRLRGPHDCGEECPWHGMSDPPCRLRCLDCGYVGDRVFIQRTPGGPWRDALHPHVILMRGNNVCSLCGSERLQLVTQIDAAVTQVDSAETGDALPFQNPRMYNEGDKVTVIHAGQEVTMQVTEALWQSDRSVRLTCRWPTDAVEGSAS